MGYQRWIQAASERLNAESYQPSGEGVCICVYVSVCSHSFMTKYQHASHTTEVHRYSGLPAKISKVPLGGGQAKISPWLLHPHPTATTMSMAHLTALQLISVDTKMTKITGVSV